MEESAGELRKINCDMGSLTRSDGSAIFTLGQTCVIAAVNGPCATTLRKLSIDEAVVDVSYRPRLGQTGIQDKVTEATLTRICSNAILKAQFPRTAIDVIVQEMHDAGGLLSCCINGMCAALINSGLPMKFLFAAVCCSIDHQDHIVLDPNLTQLKDSKAVFTLTMEGTGKIIASDIRGTYTQDQFQQIVTRCQAATKQIFQFYRDIVKKYSDRIAL